MVTVDLRLGDCLEVMPTLPQVDAIITNLPYGTTACAWDEVIPFAPMWAQVKRILKPRGVFVTTASQPFTSALIMSNPGWFKYGWVWNKKLAGNAINSDYQPLKIHEDVCVFSENGHTWNPIMRKGELRTKMWDAEWHGTFGDQTTRAYKSDQYKPTSILPFFLKRAGREHPTQKPLELLEYLILTYTNPGDTVLDICAGSGTTGCAATLTGRNAILIEKDSGYFAVMEKRIKQAQMQPPLFAT